MQALAEAALYICILKCTGLSKLTLPLLTSYTLPYIKILPKMVLIPIVCTVLFFILVDYYWFANFAHNRLFLFSDIRDIKFPDGNRVSFCPFCLQATLNITVVNDDEVEGIEEIELMMNISSEFAPYVQTHVSVKIKIIDDDCKFTLYLYNRTPYRTTWNLAMYILTYYMNDVCTKIVNI